MVSTNNMNSCTDEEFMDLWDIHQSVAKLANILGITDRAVNYRRRNIEKRYQVKLGGADHRSIRYDATRPKSFSPLKQVELGMLDGCVIVFSDAHFIPGQRTTAFKGLLWAIEHFKPKAIICNGDAFDGASISRHDVTELPQSSVVQELKACQGALGEIEEVAKAARHNVKLLFTWGNHDIRFGNRSHSSLCGFTSFFNSPITQTEHLLPLSDTLCKQLSVFWRRNVRHFNTL